MANDKYKIDVEIATQLAQKAIKDLEIAVSKFEKSNNKATGKVVKEFDSIEDSIEDVGDAAKKKLSKATEDVKDFGDAAGKAGDKAGNGFGKSTSAFSVFQGVLAGGLALKAVDMLAEAATQLFRTFVVDGVNAARIQEDAVNGLATAMRTAGDFSQGALDDFMDFASGIQATTAYGDEAIIAQLGLAKAFGATNEQAKLVAQASVELAAAQGKSLDEATRQVSKTLGGFAGELGEVSPAIKALTADQLKNGDAARVLIEQYGGTAAGRVTTFSGAISQAGNAFGDLQESIGNFIVKNPAFISALNNGTKVLLELAGSLSETAIRKFGTEAEKAALDMGKLEERSIGLQFQLSQLKDELSDDGSWWSRTNNKGVEAKIKLGEQLLEETEIQIARYQEILDKQRQAEEEAERNRPKKPQGLAEMGDEGNFAKQLADENANVQSAYDLRLEALRLLKEQELLTEEEFQDQRLALLAEKKVREEEIVNAARLTNQINEKTQSAALEQINQKYQLAVTSSQNELTKHHKKELEERKKAEAAIEKQRFSDLRSSLSYTASLMNESSNELFAIGKAAALAQATIDGYAAIQKAWAIGGPFGGAMAAAVGVATAANIAKIASTQPGSSGRISSGPGNIPTQIEQDVTRLDLQIAEKEQVQSGGDDSSALSEEIVRLRKEREALKKQIEIERLRNEVNSYGKYANGGIVPGTSYMGDKVRANVNSGEMILNRTQQRQLFEVANGAGGSDASKIDRAIGLLTQVMNQPISIQIDGREIVNVTRAQLQSGRTL